MVAADWIVEASDKELVEALCDVDEGLTTWEMNFVDSLSKWLPKPLTTRPGGQRETAEKIMRKADRA